MPSLNLTAQLHALRSKPIGYRWSSSVVMADRRITVSSDDQALFADFFTMFGAAPPVAGSSNERADMQLDVVSAGGGDYGWFRLSGDDTLPLDGGEFRFATSLAQGTFETIDGAEPGWTCVAVRGGATPAFAFRDRDCLFALTGNWRAGLMWFLFWRLLRLRDDAIFFHASAMGIGGKGTIFVGPSGGGKSTTALSLAARGHMLLSDEVAGYLPATGKIVPFRRPVGIKPGPRCDAVNRALQPEHDARIRDEGFVRFDVNTLFPVSDPYPVPLDNIVFLRGFADRPMLKRITPGRGEIAELQPLMGSFLNAAHGRRVFDLTRLLGRAKVYELKLGGPDETADYLEHVIA
ncbi:hypothetical protein SPAN111604_04225 [Sphingomonas antarctica]|uniref:hypothetical protein n=1 Tax=Sphingomonas antarctica TaxID=2040274 RepID=UPI0039ECB696